MIAAASLQLRAAKTLLLEKAGKRAVGLLCLRVRQRKRRQQKNCEEQFFHEMNC